LPSGRIREVIEKRDAAAVAQVRRLATWAFR
jgi:hypothetical protein